MKVLLTTLGRSHFIQVASSLVRSGVDLTLFQGWTVREPRKSWILKLAAWLFGRSSIFYGFEKRSPPELKGHCLSDFWSEALDAVLRTWSWKLGSRAGRFFSKTGFVLHGWRTRRILRRGEYDVFHVRTGFGAGGAIEAAHAAGVKVLADHSAGSPWFALEASGKKLDKSDFHWLILQDCLKADLLMVDCDWVKETFRMYGFPMEKVRVVYMGLDLKFNGLKKWTEDLSGIGRSADKPLRVVFTGAFAYHKGNEAFLGAVERLLDSGHYFKFTVIGERVVSVRQERKYERALKAIEFLGHLPQDEMIRKMLSSQVYLFPSLSEGCAKSAYEALSMGLCVTCTKETGLPMTDGKDGFIIGTKDPDSIAQRLLWYVDHPDEMRRAGQAGTETMKYYTWERYAENVKKVYEELREKNLEGRA